MRRKNEVFAATLIACMTNDKLDFSDFKYMRNDKIASMMVRKHKRDKRRGWQAEPLTGEELKLVNRVVDSQEFTGDFIMEFLDWLIENGPEIIALIMKIVALFGEEVDSYELNSLSTAEESILNAVFGVEKAVKASKMDDILEMLFED